ncbi:MAG: hypothetical protein KDA79_11245 [Planctomycetaceae bacterium]|nr:hypothetical protein [Planctomycetaceae bacterium]
MERRNEVAGWVVAGVVLCGLAGCGNGGDSNLPLLSVAATSAGPRADEVDAAISLSAAYLERQVEPDGQFVYWVHQDPDLEMPDKYNILRHAGTIYSLCMAYDLTGDGSLREPVRRTVQYLRQQAIGSVDGHPEMLAVWSHPQADTLTESRSAKLGGTGLGLVALLSAEAVEPGLTPAEELRSLGRFLLYLQKRDGSFYSKFDPALWGRDDSWNSLYYPGEAALGLVMLYQYDGAAQWRDSAVAALGYLARSRKDSSSVPADHWALLATEQLFLADEQLEPATRELLADHARQICRSMVAEQVNQPGSVVHGGFVTDGRTTPAATRLEGLLATLAWLPADDSLRAELELAVAEGTGFLLRAQVPEGEYSGGIPRSISTSTESSREAAVFNMRAEEIRIDYVQHALSAMIRYRRLMGR